MTAIHAAARLGFSREAQAYVRGRPEYPAALLPWLTDDLGVAPGKVVVELGAGTGKFTKLLVDTGAHVIAVEPVAAMRAQLASILPGVQQLPGIDGRLGLTWNVRDESVDWVATITEIITPYGGDAPRFSKGAWRRAFSGRCFTELEQSSFAYQHVGTAPEVILDRFLSVSFIAALPPHEKANVASRLRALIASHPALRDRDVIAFPYKTEAYRCTRLEDGAARI